MDGAAPTDSDEPSVETARGRVGDYAAPVDRTDRVPLSVAVGRVLASDATATDAVADAGIDAGDPVFHAGHRLRTGDVGVLKAAGVDELLVRQRPQVGIVPTGDELVARDPGEGERVETTGFTLAQYVDRWGGKVTYRNTVADDAPALRMAVQRDLTRDVVVVTGTEPGDTLREVVADLGTVVADRLSLAPGGETGLAVVQDRPVVLLPESPTGARVAAVELLRPLLNRFAGAPTSPHPTTTATTVEAIDTDSGVRSLVPVTVDDGRATPLADCSLGTATRADGWVRVRAGATGPAAGETVAVEDWDYLP